MDKAWKRTERGIAKFLGGERVPITGRQRGSVPDIKHKWLSIEVKHRASLPQWLSDALSQAQASVDGDQLPIAVLHESGANHADDMIVVRAGNFTDWFGT